MNPQERFWKGGFGNDYTQRNRVEWTARIPFWQHVLSLTEAGSVLDVGCNAGWNMRAIRAVNPDIRTVGIDVNEEALADAVADSLDARQASLYDAGALHPDAFDLVCTSGVLIHVPPDDLAAAMNSIVAASKRWVLAVEYPAAADEEVVYRGNTGLLWKRPFGDLYQAMGLSLVAEFDAQGFDQCYAWLMVKP